MKAFSFIELEYSFKIYLQKVYNPELIFMFGL